MTNICRAPFSNNPKLKKFTVSTGNKYYCSDKGILYNKAKTVLLSAPSVESVNLPSTLKSIQNKAFLCNPNLKSISIPNSVTYIGAGALSGDKLRTVKLNNAKVDIGKWALGGDNLVVFGSNNVKSVDLFGMTSGFIVAPTGSVLHKYAQSHSQVKYQPYMQAPANVKVKARNGKITLNWSKVPYAGAYKVYIKKKPTDTFKEVKRVSNKTLSTTISAPEGGVYYVTVKGYNSIQGGKYNTYKVDTRKLSAPSKVNYSNRNGNVTLNWSKVAGAGSYQVFAKKSLNERYKLMKTVNNRTTSATFKTPAKGYIYVTVKAVSSTRDGYYTNYRLKVR